MKLLKNVLGLNVSKPKFVKTVSKQFFKVNFLASAFGLKAARQEGLSKPSFPHKSFATQQRNKELEEFMQNYEEKMKEAKELSFKLLSVVERKDEKEIFSLIRKLNELPVRLVHLEELKTYFSQSLNKIPLTQPQSLVDFLQFVDKMEIENFDQIFTEIENKFKDMILSNKFDLNQLATIAYAYSKYQIKDEAAWEHFCKSLDGKLNEVGLSDTTKILLAFTMIGDFAEKVISKVKMERLYQQMFQNIENKISSLTYLDTFRICISLTKKPVDLRSVSEKVWGALQNNFKNNIKSFDLYQISHILMLLCETPYLDPEIFPSIERDVISEYLERVDDMVKEMDLSSFLDDLSKICFAFALTRQGSNYMWSLVLKTYIQLNKNISRLTLENMLFVCHTLIDYLNNLKESSFETNKRLQSFFESLEEKIISEKLLTNNKIDPYNTMMPFARFGNTNKKIWDDLTKIILGNLSEQKVINPFLLCDIVFAYSNYYINLVMERDIHPDAQKQIESHFYIQKFQEFWNKMESLLLELDPKYIAAPQLANFVIDFSQIDAELTKAWEYLTKAALDRINEFDKNHLLMVLMGFSRKDIAEQSLWTALEQRIGSQLENYDLEGLRKIVLSFLKNKEKNKAFWNKLEEKFSSDQMLTIMNFEYFQDMQIPFALVSIKSDKIWKKIEELAFKNLSAFNENKDILMNTIYSFSRTEKGSPLLWAKFAQIVKENLGDYDIDDLGHLAVCLRPSNVVRNKIEQQLNKYFWDNFADQVEKNFHHSTLNSLNNLLKGMKENDYTKDKELLMKRIEDRINTLLSEIK